MTFCQGLLPPDAPHRYQSPRVIAENGARPRSPSACPSLCRPLEATASPGHTADELEKAIDEELARLAAKAPSREELTRAQRGFETRQKLIFVARRLSHYNHLAGPCVG
jgi:hypothetical protein